VVKAGHVVRFSTEDCTAPVMVHVDIDGVRHWVRLGTQTDEGATGFFRVPHHHHCHKPWPSDMDGHGYLSGCGGSTRSSARPRSG
jgi:hypothetical protein